MPDLDLLVNQNLTGWKIIKCYELRNTVDEIGDEYKIGGYFKDKNMAIFASKRSAAYGGDGEVVEIYALVSSDVGEAGFIFEAPYAKVVFRSIRQEEIKARAVKEALNKLTPEEKALLGL